MSRFRITVAYDGTDYVGWQRQASGVSIQGLLEGALRELDGGAVTVAGAGRTDAGVHALGQVAGFALTRTIEADAVMRALNARLPDTVRVLASEEVPPDFHPRFAARSKSYRYRIWNAGVMSPFERRYAWHVSSALDVEAMNAAARALEGRHDFASFQSAGSDATSTERTLSSSLVLRHAQDERRKDSLVVSPSTPLILSLSKDESLRTGLSNHEPVISYDVTGDGFLRHMVRAIVGTLVEIGRGRRPPEWIREVLAARDRGAAGPTAPAAGLFLVRVEY